VQAPLGEKWTSIRALLPEYPVLEMAVGEMPVPE
jgi:hypothetical protein